MPELQVAAGVRPSAPNCRTRRVTPCSGHFRRFQRPARSPRRSKRLSVHRKLLNLHRMNDSRPGLGAVDTWKGWASAWRAFGFDNAPGGSPPTSGSRQDRLPQSETRNPEVHANWALRRILAQSQKIIEESFPLLKPAD